MNQLITVLVLPIINSVFALILPLYFFSHFANGKNKKNYYIVGAAFLVFALSLIFVNISALRLVITGICTFLFTFAYRMKLYNRIWLSTVFVAISMLCEVATSVSIMIIFDTDYFESLGGLFFILGILISKFYSFSICFMLARSKHYLLAGRFRKDWLALYSLPAATILTICIIHYMMPYIPGENKIKATAAVCMLLLILANLMIFRIADSIRESALAKNRLEISEQLIKEQSEQYRLLFENNRDIRKIRHDHRNFLLGILSDLDTDNVSSASVKLRERLEILDGTKGIVTGNSVIDTVLGYKSSLAERKGITIDLKFRNISALSIMSTDLSVLLGNAIDNAVEATSKLGDEQEKSIRLVIAVLYDKVYITIANPVDHDIDTDSLYTNKADSEHHGFGIISMKTVAAKYDGEVLFECQNKEFRTMITLSNGTNIECSVSDNE